MKIAMFMLSLLLIEIPIFVTGNPGGAPIWIAIAVGGAAGVGYFFGRLILASRGANDRDDDCALDPLARSLREKYADSLTATFVRCEGVPIDIDGQVAYVLPANGFEIGFDGPLEFAQHPGDLSEEFYQVIHYLRQRDLIDLSIQEVAESPDDSIDMRGLAVTFKDA